MLMFNYDTLVVSLLFLVGFSIGLVFNLRWKKIIKNKTFVFSPYKWLLTKFSFGKKNFMVNVNHFTFYKFLLCIFATTLITSEVCKYITLTTLTFTTTNTYYDVNFYLPAFMCSYFMFVYLLIAFDKNKSKKYSDNLTCLLIISSTMTVVSLFVDPAVWCNAVTKFSERNYTDTYALFSFIYHGFVILFSSFLLSGFFKKIPTPKISIVALYSIFNFATMIISMILGNTRFNIYGGNPAHWLPQLGWIYEKFGEHIYTYDIFAFIIMELLGFGFYVLSWSISLLADIKSKNSKKPETTNTEEMIKVG